MRKNRGRQLSAWGVNPRVAGFRGPAVPAELADYDAIIFGTPTRFGNMAAQMRNFLDQTGGLWVKGALVARTRFGSQGRCSLNRQSGGQRRRWELNPLKTGLQPVAVAVWLQRRVVSVLAKSRTWSSTFAESRAIRHTPRTSSRRAADRTGPAGFCLRRRLPARYLPLHRPGGVLPPHTGWRPGAVRCRRSPTGPQAGTCPASTWSCPSAGR